VDADFLGLYDAEDSDDPMSFHSCTGYVILLANCLLFWVSKLQTEISVSTLVSEFVSLSTSMCSLIPMKRLFGEVLCGLDLVPRKNIGVATKSHKSSKTMQGPSCN
jgi:hypothetical protein